MLAIPYRKALCSYEAGTQFAQEALQRYPPNTPGILQGVARGDGLWTALQCCKASEMAGRKQQALAIGRDVYSRISSRWAAVYTSANRLSENEV